MKLSPLGEIAAQELLNIQSHRPNVLIHCYVVMPNHVHALIELRRDTTCRVRHGSSGKYAFGPLKRDSLMSVIGSYKAAVTRNWRKSAAAASRGPADPQASAVVWQARYHDHIVRNEQDYLRIWQYIQNNPARWKEDCFYNEPGPAL